jgi:hypothetical protein
MSEQWKPIAGYEGRYEVSSLGRVRSLSQVIESTRAGKPFRRKHAGKVLAPRVNRWGYQQIHLGGGTKTPSVHSLVATAFHGPKPTPQHQVNHINGVKTDNRADNLEWLSNSENMAHAFRTGLGRHGERAGNTRLTSAQVIELRTRRSSGETLSALASEYEMSVSGVHAIAHGKNWKHLRERGAE